MEKQNELIQFKELQKPEVFRHISESVQAHVQQNGLVVQFKTKKGDINNYPTVEAWQYAGAMLGIFASLIELQDISEKINEIKYQATVELIEAATGKRVTKATAICSNKENSKKYSDEYVIASMAQTRAVGKAFRLVLGWIMKASGFEPTPAEEMQFQENEKSKPSDPAILHEFKRVCMQVVGYCSTAQQLKDLVSEASLLSQDAEFLDSARNRWNELQKEVTE